MKFTQNFPVKAAEQRFERADDRFRDASTDKERAKICKEWWEAIRDACHAYSDPRNLHSKMPEQFPASISRALYVFVGNAINKNPDYSFDSLFAGRGSSRLPVLAIADLERACMYIKAADLKIISDRTPIKTISTWYGVSASTVHGWKGRYDVTEKLLSFCPDAANIERGRLLASKTKISGARYRKAGRGQSAVRLRENKRKTPNKSAR